MTQNEVKLSTIRCEPHNVDNSDCREEYYGLQYPFECILWRVFVDDECISENALPFLSSDEFIELSANKCVPYFGDGGQYVTARLFEDKVFWFGFNLRMPFDFEYVPLSVNAIRMFDAVQYKQMIDQINAASAEREHVKEAKPTFLRSLLDYLFGTPVVETKVKPTPQPIPILTRKEIQAILIDLFPRDLDLPLYRVPELAVDRRGARLFRTVWDAINTGKVQISDPPPITIEVHIGLDTRDFSESVWRVGKLGDNVAILFVSEPHFPLWLTGFQSIIPLLNEAL